MSNVAPFVDLNDLHLRVCSMVYVKCGLACIAIMWFKKIESPVYE